MQNCSEEDRTLSNQEPKGQMRECLTHSTLGVPNLSPLGLMENWKRLFFLKVSGVREMPLDMKFHPRQSAETGKESVS